jgi:hypothetical protein
LSHMRRERFLVITLPAVQNECSGAAEVAAGIARTRLAMTPNNLKGDRCTVPRQKGN